MSVERELLKECRLMLDNPINGTAGRNLQIRITELFAQPEPEPVAWKTKKKSYLDEIDRLSMEANKDQEEIDRLTQLLTQSERKPLTDEDICEILIKKEWKGFVDLVRIIEKAHGIGGGE
jgi:hypothetical protein